MEVPCPNQANNSNVRRFGASERSTRRSISHQRPGAPALLRVLQLQVCFHFALNVDGLLGEVQLHGHALCGSFRGDVRNKFRSGIGVWVGHSEMSQSASLVVFHVVLRPSCI